MAILLVVLGSLWGDRPARTGQFANPWDERLPEGIVGITVKPICSPRALSAGNDSPGGRAGGRRVDDFIVFPVIPF